MLCLNSFCLFILKRSVWIEFPGWRFLWIIVLQTLKERSERFFTFETMNTFLTLENIIINIHRFPSKTHYLHTYVPPLENIYSSNHKDLWHLRRWLQYRQLRTWINDNLSYLTINCDTGQHSQFLRCFLYNDIFCWDFVGFSHNNITMLPPHLSLGEEPELRPNLKRLSKLTL